MSKSINICWSSCTTSFCWCQILLLNRKGGRHMINFFFKFKFCSFRVWRQTWTCLQNFSLRLLIWCSYLNTLLNDSIRMITVLNFKGNNCLIYVPACAPLIDKFSGAKQNCPNWWLFKLFEDPTTQHLLGILS